MANLEAANRFFYDASYNIAARKQKTKPPGYNSALVEISAMLSDAIPANKIIEMNVVLGYSKLGGPSPTSWQRRAIVFTETKNVDTWLTGHFFFKGYPLDEEGVWTYYIERRNDAGNPNGDPATTTDLFVRRTTVMALKV